MARWAGPGLGAGIVVAITLALAGPAPGDFAEGLEAFDGGDYATALSEWKPLAESGDPHAQVALAWLYRGGLGVPQDDSKAALWYRRAAEQGHAVAQLNLGEMYLTGQGVSRDLVQAYAWLSLAAAQGNAWAAKSAAEVAWMLSSEEMTRAGRLIEEWGARATER